MNDICTPPRPARIVRELERLTSAPVSGRPSSSFTTPRTASPRRRTTVTPDRVPPGDREIPPTARSSNSSWRTSSRWFSPGARRVARKEPSRPVRTAPSPSMLRMNARKTLSPPRETCTSAPSIGAPSSLTTRPASVAPRASGTSCVSAWPAATVTARDQGTKRSSSAESR